MTSLLRRFIADDRGQDLIEYGLLSAFVGLAAILAWVNIAPAIGNAYQGWDSGVQGISACTPDPGGGGC